MATRRERVVLDLEDNFSSGMARASAATALLKRELNSLSGSALRSTSRDMDSAAKSTENLGKSSDGAGKQIDRLSGRLVLIAKTAAVLGPALVPIGAAAVPALAAMTTQLGLAAAAAGVTALAMKGMGDGLKTLNAYQLEPSAANFQKLQIEMEKLGPAGAHFVRFLDSVTPQLRELQNTAREGMLPGVEEGIANILRLGPQLNDIVAEIASAMGELSADAGAGLAGPRFAAFFDYLETQGRPILLEMGATVGNFVDGLAAMVVAFAPLTADFSGGLERMSKAFADWAHSLDSSTSFQDFLSYVQESGPKVLDLLGSLSALFVDIVQAAAPVGAIVLPALTELVDIFATLVGSPIGTVFVAAAAAMSAYSLAATVAAAATTRLGASAAFASRSFLPLAALAATALAVRELAQANDDLAAATQRASNAADFGGSGSQARAFEDLSRQIQQAKADVNDFQDLFRFRDSGGDSYIENLSGAWRGLGIALTGGTGAAESALSGLQGAMRGGSTVADLFGQTVGLTGDALRDAAVGAEEFSGALGRLNGWLDKRQALRDYADAVEKVAGALKGEFGREGVENVDALARSIAQVATQLKGSARTSFLSDARAQLVKMARDAGPAAQRSIENLIGKLDQLGLTRPKVKIDADDRPALSKIERTNREAIRLGRQKVRTILDADPIPAQGKMRNVFSDLYRLDRTKADPRVSADTGAAHSALDGVAGLLNSLDGRVATVRVNTIRTTLDFIESGTLPPVKRATGGPIYGPGSGTSDEVPIWASNGEHMWTAREVANAGGHAAVEAIRNQFRYANGGAIDIARYAAASRQPSHGGGASTVKHVIEVRVTGEMDMRRATTQLREVASQISRNEIDADRSYRGTLDRQGYR